jgi:RNA polymerase sigma-70 factor (ECF subfamily)
MNWFQSRQQRELAKQIEASRERVFRVAFAWCHDADLADDLTQDALSRGLVNAAQLREDEKLNGWLMAILHRCWIDYLRSRRVHESEEVLAELPSDLPGPDGYAETRETVRRVRAAVAALPLGQRQVITLVDLEELSYAEVAEILVIPIGTVMSRICRARTALRVLLEAEPARKENHLRCVK